MTPLLLAFLLASPSEALFGRQPRAAVLWVPEASFESWSQLEGALGRYGDVRLTIGLTPSQVTAEARKALDPWIAQRRVELALRLEGDPILPLVATQAAERLAAEKELFRAAAGAAPAGLVPGAGALDAPLISMAEAMGFSWAAVGEYAASSSAWAAQGRLALAPCRAPQTLGGELTADALKVFAGGVVAVDEAGGFVPAGSLTRLIAAMDAQTPSGGWALVSELAEAARQGARKASTVKEWPTWAGGLAPWTAGPRSKANWALYSQAAEALARWQNSGSAELTALDAAAAELQAAQASRYYGALSGPEAEASDRELRSRLIAVYRKMRQTPPESLFRRQAPGEDALADEAPTAVRVAQTPDSVEFVNPAGSLSRAASGLALEDGSPPHLLFKLESLRVDASEAALAFTYTLGKLDSAAHPEPPPGAAPEMGRVLIETYIDVNNQPNSGSGTLLADKTAFIHARDAWEYALSVSAWGAFLYRSTPLGAPIQAARVGVSADPASREIRVSVPRALLRGNPLRWGFVTLAYAADPASASKPPAKPKAQPKGPTALGLLAPLEQQQALARSAENARPRLAAIRAK